MKFTKQKVMVACTNASGEADIFTCTVKVSEKQLLRGEHYDQSEKLAKENGYEGPFVCFDSHEQKNIARQVTELDCPIPFKLLDKCISNDNSKEVNGRILFGWDGVSFQIEEYSDYHSENDQGIVAYLEYWNESANLRVYDNINSEEPNSISLEGARNKCRETNQ